ncbi:MAG: EAL domain-containing protein [Gammaproteobacteria bacterium]
MKAAPKQQSNKGSCNRAESAAPRPGRRGGPASGLRGRLLILVVLTLLPAFGIVLYTGHSQLQAAQGAAQHHALSVTLEAAADQARLVDEARTLLTVLARMPAIDHLKRSCPPFLHQYVLGQPRLANIGVIDATGRLICNAAHPTTDGLDLSDRAYFKRAVSRDRFAIGDYQTGRITGQPVLVAAYPVRDARGNLRQVLFAAMRLGWLNAVAARAGLPEGSIFTLLDSAGRVLARYPGASGLLGRQAPEAAALQRLAPGNGPWAGRERINGRDWLVTYAALGTRPSLRGLHVAVAIPTSVAFAAANHTLYRNLTLLTALGLVSLTLAWFAGELLVLRPVRHLVQATHRIAAGNLGARTGISTGPHEIVSLGRALDDMASALEQRAHQNEAQNRRIARLNRIYRMLSAINGAIIRIRDRDQLVQEACRITVDLGDFPFAWIGLIEPGDGSLRAVAHAGTAKEFVQGVRVTLNPDEPEGSGVMGEAVRSGMHVVSNDVQRDPRLLARRKEFQALNIHSAAAFPLRIQRRVVGALALHSEEPGFFDAQELALLDEVAADTSLGLEHIEKERQLNYLAYWDPLTNLPNRSLFEDRLGQSLRRAERSAAQVVVLIVDITHFARINDTKGRAAGDRVLLTVAARLATVVRDSESLADLGSQAARLGGHEFGLVLDDIGDIATAGKVADRIADALATPGALEDEGIAITIRMGAAVYPRDGTQPEELLHNAQFAVHSLPPGSPDNLAFYSPAQDTAAKARFALEKALRDAVDNEEFYLEYQPRVDVQTGRLAGAEALIRWERPDHGRVPPDQFIPVLEEMGLIDRVGEWVARTAFGQRLAWRDAVPDAFVLSINASSHELRTPDYVSRVRRIMEAVGVRPEWVEIEITETGLVETGNATLEMLSGLKALGLHLSIDDFGTGYSSLSYLRQFPVDTLKIDQSFIRDIDRDHEALSIVRSIMALAKALKLTVVAEGVETEQQMRLLAEEHCHEIQGYYFSRPLAPGALLELASKDPPFRV